jgi:5,6,7,8-tetrahydromethanopterin hydro-lyase
VHSAIFGPAQHAVAKAVADSVTEGVIPLNEADDLFICVGVFIHWEATMLDLADQYDGLAKCVGGSDANPFINLRRGTALRPLANHR